MADSDRHDDDNEGRQNTRLLEQIEMRLAEIKAILSQPNTQLAEIIRLLTPPPSDDIKSLGGTISTPVKK